MLKNHMVGRHNKIKRDVMYGEALQDPQAPRRASLTWAELLHDTANHVREVGWKHHRRSPGVEMQKDPKNR